MGIPSLPLPAPDQRYCEVSALDGGFLDMPDHLLVSTAKPGERHIVPSLAFLLTHAQTRARLLFDLGMDPEHEYTEVYKARPHIGIIHKPVPPVDIVSSLKKGGLKPEDVSHICLSHVHWDHVGNPSLFPKAEFIVGGEARKLFSPGFPTNPKSAFPEDLLPAERTKFVDTENDDWRPVGPFPRALDYFGDGALYIVDSPGHLPGHLNILARTSNDGAWIYLAGDSAHDWRLVRGEGNIAEFVDESRGRICIHSDVQRAAEHIRRVADMTTLPRVRVLLAHDNEWYDANKDGNSFWPGKIPSL